MTSSGMSYCPLEEAFGSEYAKLYENNMNDIPRKSDDTSEDSESFFLDRELGSIRDSISKSNKNHDHDDTTALIPSTNTTNVVNTVNCSKFLEHYLTCSNCRNLLKKMLWEDDGSKKIRESGSELVQRVEQGPEQVHGNIVEKFVVNGKSGLIETDFFDIIVLILVGILVIFILDCFVRLGRSSLFK